MLTHSDFHFRLTYSSSSHSILNGSSFLSWKRCESISSLSPLLFVFFGFCLRLCLRLCLSLGLLWPFPCLCFYSFVSVSVFILNVSFLLSLYLFLVADTQFYKRLCLSVGPSIGQLVRRLVRWSMNLSREWENKCLEAFWVYIWGVGCGLGLDAPAHPSATILWPCVTCFCFPMSLSQPFFLRQFHDGWRSIEGSNTYYALIDLVKSGHIWLISFRALFSRCEPALQRREVFLSLSPFKATFA